MLHGSAAGLCLPHMFPYRASVVFGVQMSKCVLRENWTPLFITGVRVWVMESIGKAQRIVFAS